jgi:hypothetical protein
MLAVIDCDGNRRPLTIPFTELLTPCQTAYLLAEHRIPPQDRRELAGCIRQQREPSAGLLRRANCSDGRYRRCWDAAFENMERNLNEIMSGPLLPDCMYG